MSEEKIVYQCSHIGISGTTPVHVRKLADGTFEARVGIAIIGITNMDEAEFESCGYDPFSEKFHDNWASGKGATEAEALEDLKADMQSTADGLWAM